MGVFSDAGYRTRLGTAFYDRVGELAALDEAASRPAVHVVYGPRQVGKSELARYWAWRSRAEAVVVDARLLRVKGTAWFNAVYSPRREIVEALTRAAEAAGIRWVVDLLDAAAVLLRGAGGLLGARRLVVVVDEFHELPGYRRGRGGEEALGDLEALAALLAKEEGLRRVTFILTVSEGFAVSHEARRALRGYPVEWLLVEHLDEPHSRALYHEYTRRHGCRQGFGVLYALFGGTPGLLPRLCSLDESRLRQYLRDEWLLGLEAALSVLRNELGLASGHEALRLALRVMEGAVRPLRDPLLYRAGDVLTRENIVYPVWGGQGVLFKPQYPVYRVVLVEAVRAGVESLIDLDPGRFIPAEQGGGA